MNLSIAQWDHVINELSHQHQNFDNIATVLAQAAIADGTIFLAAFGEMKAVTAVALNSTPPLCHAAEWSPSSIVTHTDRVWILAVDQEGDELAGRLSDAGIPFAWVSTQNDDQQLADAFLCLRPKKTTPLRDASTLDLVPHVMAALYVYYAVKSRMELLVAEA